MAVIQLKRGTSTPSTGNVTNIGEMAFNYSSNELYIRSASSMVKVGGGDYELVFNYEGAVSNYKLNYNFDRNYIYKIHVIAATSGTDTSNTVFSYYTYNGSSAMYGAFTCMYIGDNYSSISKATGKNTSSFYIYDAYTNSVSASYATTKIIDFELSPTFESSINSTYTWMVHGISVTGGSDQSNTPITNCMFSHVIDASLGGILINPGLDVGSLSFSVSVYRSRRK